MKLLPQKSDEMLEMGCLGSGGSPSLEAFKERVDVVLRDLVSGHSGDGLTVGLGDLRGLLQPW